jgi:hypothetical protein
MRTFLYYFEIVADHSPILQIVKSTQRLRPSRQGPAREPPRISRTATIVTDLLIVSAGLGRPVEGL